MRSKSIQITFGKNHQALLGKWVRLSPHSRIPIGVVSNIGFGWVDNSYDVFIREFLNESIVFNNSFKENDTVMFDLVDEDELDYIRMCQ